MQTLMALHLASDEALMTQCILIVQKILWFEVQGPNFVILKSFPGPLLSFLSFGIWKTMKRDRR